MTPIEPDGPVIATGSWKDNITWRMLLGNVLPPQKLCTAVGCIAIFDLSKDEVVLTRNQRGWEILAGHIEPGETIEEALFREALEEGGFTASNPIFFGYREMIAHEPPAQSSRAARYHYPYPLSCIPYFYSVTDREIIEPTGEEILGRAVYSLAEIEGLVECGLMKTEELAIIRAGLEAAHAKPEHNKTLEL